MHRQENKIKRLKKRGFTLVELMMTIAIMMVLVVAGKSTLFSTNAASERDSAINAIANILTFARVGAMSHGVAYEVSIEGLGLTSETSKKNIAIYKMTSNICNYPSFVDQPVKTLNLQQKYPGVTITKVHVLQDYTSKGAHVWFCFQPDGTVRDATGNFLNNSDIVWNGAHTGNGVQIFLRSFQTSNGKPVGTESIAIAPYMGSPRVVRGRGNL